LNIIEHEILLDKLKTMLVKNRSKIWMKRVKTLFFIFVAVMIVEYNIW
jgi:hypothetical protein